MELVQEDNLQMREELEEERKRSNEFHDTMMQLQVEIENLRNNGSGSPYNELPRRSSSGQLMQNFRARSELLISHINDLDHVEYDDNLSSDEDLVEEVTKEHWINKN